MDGIDGKVSSSGDKWSATLFSFEYEQKVLDVVVSVGVVLCRLCGGGLESLPLLCFRPVDDDDDDDDEDEYDEDEEDDDDDDSASMACSMTSSRTLQMPVLFSAAGDNVGDNTGDVCVANGAMSVALLLLLLTCCSTVDDVLDVDDDDDDGSHEDMIG